MANCKKKFKKVKKQRAEYKKKLPKKLQSDFERTVFAVLAVLEQHGGDELYSARGIELKYEIVGGMIRRSASASWCKFSSNLVEIPMKERVFGRYADVYKAFKKFDRNLDMYRMRIVKPKLPDRDCTDTTFTYQVLFE